MNQELDFDRLWLSKFSRCLDGLVGEAIRTQVMQGSKGLSAQSSRATVVAWTKGAMERLDDLVDDEARRRDIMTCCACQYPKASLEPIRRLYEETKDVDRAHGMLQDQFESFLTDTMQLSQRTVEDIVERGWGSAGYRKGSTVVATKIPKSAFLLQYMEERDPEKRRQLYCHCPRVRNALKMGETLSPTYCYCGAGFYKGIWEEILQQPVRVEVLESVLQGGDVCRIAIHLAEPL